MKEKRKKKFDQNQDPTAEPGVVSESIFGSNDRSEKVDQDAPQSSHTTPKPAPTGGLTGVAKAGLVGLVVVVLYLATWGSRAPKPSDETVYPNWNTHVTQVVEENTKQNTLPGVAQGQLSSVKYVEKAGASSFVTEVALEAKDLDENTTQTLSDHLKQGDQAQAQEVLQAAQKIPVPSDPEIQKLVKEPTVTTGMADLFAKGDGELYRVFLYDSCAEDGDVVDVVIDGTTFATVPITHKGATLSVPIPRGGDVEVGLRGVRDGVGGITVACRTSSGDYFMQVMAEGQYQSIRMGAK